MVDEVLYLGFKVNKYGVSPVKEKIGKRSNGNRKKNHKMFLKVQNELKIIQKNLSILSDKNILAHHGRSSHQWCSINNGVLENFAKLTGKQSAFFNKAFF